MELRHIINEAGLKIKDNAPQIMTGVGLATMVIGTVFACKATLKLPDIIGESEEKLERIRAIRDEKPNEYSEDDAKKATTIIKTKTILECTKNYLVPAGIITAGAALIVGSDVMDCVKNTRISAALLATEESYKAYRKYVETHIGKDMDRKARIGAEEETIVDENGNEKTIEVVDRSHIEEYSQYARFFDVGNTGWSEDPELSLMALRRIQSWANDRLKTKGYVFLNEVYRALGYPETAAGHRVGWLLNGDGDGKVDFGIYNPRSKNCSDFVNGWEPVIILDFNVDGDIVDRLYNRR